MFRPGNAKGPKFTHLGQLKDVLARSDIVVDDAGCFLSSEEFRYYHHEFSKGMNGPLNYYRTAKYRHDEEQGASLNLMAARNAHSLFYRSQPSTLPPRGSPSVIHVGYQRSNLRKRCNIQSPQVRSSSARLLCRG